MMKNIYISKKITALILAFALMLSAVVMLPSAFAEELSEVTDIIKPEQEIKLLSGLGIIDASEYDEAGDGFTRGEFAHRMVSVLDLQDSNMSGGLPFRDVPSDYPYYQDILKCVAYGVMNGYSETSFMPNQLVTSSEVVVVIMRALGYEPIAESQGGYLEGYLTHAAKENLLDGISSEVMGGICTDWAFALLAYNMLDIPVYSNASLDTDNWELTRGDAYMTSILGIKQTEGVLMGNAVTSIDSGKSTGDGYVRIDDSTYRISDSSLDSYVGYPVTAYYTKGAAVPEIIYACVTDESCGIMVYKDDIDENSLKSGRISYTEADSYKTRTKTINKGAYLLYNNKPAVSLQKMTGDGVYILIDNDNNGDIDVVRMEEYRNTFVNYVNMDEGLIYDKYKLMNNIDISSKTVGEDLFIYNHEGEKIDAAALEASVVYSCVRSADDDVIVMRAVIDEVFGIVEGGVMDENGHFEEISVGGRTVPVSDEMKTELEDEDILIGKSSIIGYLGATGKMVAFDNVTSDGKKYAYLNNVASDGGLDQKIKLQLFVGGTTNGKFTIYELADRVKIDGTSYKSSEITAITAALKSGELITFEENDAAKVESIGTISGGTLKLIDQDNDGATYYRTATMGNVGINEKTVLIFAPSTGREAAFSSGKISLLTHNENYPKYKAYITDEANVGAEAILFETDDGLSIEPAAPHMVVTKVNECVMDDGMNGFSISGYVLGSEVTYRMPSDTKCTAFGNEAVDGVRAGDVIRYSLDAQGYISMTQVLYSLEGDKIYGGKNPSQATRYAIPRVLRARVYKTDRNHMLLTYKSPSDEGFNQLSDTEMRTLSSNTVYVYDKNARGDKKIKIGSIRDILTWYEHGDAYSDVFAVTRGEWMETLIVIK